MECKECNSESHNGTAANLAVHTGESEPVAQLLCCYLTLHLSGYISSVCNFVCVRMAGRGRRYLRACLP